MDFGQPNAEISQKMANGWLLFLAPVTWYGPICISYNTGKSALPNIYTQRLRALGALGCICTWQSTSTCFIINMLRFWHSKSLPKPAQLAYIVKGTDSNCGRYSYIFITFPNVSMIYPIAVISIFISSYIHITKRVKIPLLHSEDYV